MSTPIEPLTDFDALRRAGIDYAQAASGEIWTDYNLHDPGVTLLEQTCFALSQIAYQAGLPIRDLLTDPREHFCFQDLALFKPRQVLGTDPVTRGDLAAWLCSCPGIETVRIAPPDPQRPGLYDMTIVPALPASAECNAEAEARALFARVRPLCSDLGQLSIAQPVEVILQGHVEISSESLPETAAAALYLAVGQILSGSTGHGASATRADVWNAPERLLSPAPPRNVQSLDLDMHLAQLQKLQGVDDIDWLRLVMDTLKPPEAEIDRSYRLRLPRAPKDLRLELRMNGAPVTVSIPRLREEYARLSAEAIAEARHHIDTPDWDVLRPGRRRRFSHGDVDALLPAIYRMMSTPPERGGGDLFKEYRSVINLQLHGMVESLRSLPEHFAADPRYSTSAPEMHRLRVELLDYLIALQGRDMPATRQSGLHHYMTVAARHRFEIAWRLEYLFSLPMLHRTRATGPGPTTPGGFLAELAILCDLGLTENADWTQRLGSYGLTLDPEAEPPAAAAMMLVSAHNPFDMLVPEDDRADPLDADALSPLCGFLPDRRIAPHTLAKLSEKDAFAVAPGAGGTWVVLLDLGSGHDLQEITRAKTKPEAMAMVNALRATWRHLNQTCERACLVEHVRHGARNTEKACTADLLLPGFTARTAMRSFRSYVEARVDALAPAHLHIRVRWLNPVEANTVEAAHAAAKAGEPGADAALLKCLDELGTEAIG